MEREEANSGNLKNLTTCPDLVQTLNVVSAPHPHEIFDNTMIVEIVCEARRSHPVCKNARISTTVICTNYCSWCMMIAELRAKPSESLGPMSARCNLIKGFIRSPELRTCPGVSSK